MDRIKASNAPPLEKLAPTDARVAYLEKTNKARPKPSESVHRADFELPTPAGPILIRQYSYSASLPPDPRPALIYFHGGGFVVGNIDTHDVLCQQLAAWSGVTVFSVEYRLAPEHPFPAGLEDCFSATDWIFKNAGSLSIDPQRIAIGGDSAGANLATVVCLRLKEQRTNKGFKVEPTFQLLIYPVTDLRMQSPSMSQYANGYVLTRDTMAYFRDLYTPDSKDHLDWRASPLLSTDLIGLPPTLVLTAGYDPLRDEGRMYADALSSAGVSTQYVCFERQMHGFILMGGLIDEANMAVQLCARALTLQLGGARGST